jgi:hypothetical protein
MAMHSAKWMRPKTVHAFGINTVDTVELQLTSVDFLGNGIDQS